MNQIGLSINTRGETSDEELIAIARHADEQGYHSFWLPNPGVETHSLY